MANEHIFEMGRTLAQKYILARQNREIMRGLLTKEVSDLFANTYGGHALLALRTTLIGDLIRECYATALDDDRRSPSLRRVVKKLQQPDIRSELKSEFIKEPDGGEGDNRWKTEKSQQFDGVCDGLITAWGAFVKSDLSAKIGTARNKAIAHYELVEGPDKYILTKPGLNWEDPELFLDQIPAPLGWLWPVSAMSKSARCWETARTLLRRPTATTILISYKGRLRLWSGTGQPPRPS